MILSDVFNMLISCINFAWDCSLDVFNLFAVSLSLTLVTMLTVSFILSRFVKGVWL